MISSETPLSNSQMSETNKEWERKRILPNGGRSHSTTFWPIHLLLVKKFLFAVPSAFRRKARFEAESVSNESLMQTRQ